MAKKKAAKKKVAKKVAKKARQEGCEESGQEVGWCGWRFAAVGPGTMYSWSCPAKAVEPLSKRVSPEPSGWGKRPVLTRLADLFGKLCLVTTRKERPARLTGRFYFLGETVLGLGTWRLKRQSQVAFPKAEVARPKT